MVIRDTIVEELYEYKNLGVLKHHVGSFSSNVEDNIDKTHKKVGLIFASNCDRRKVNPLVYVKLWKQAFVITVVWGGALDAYSHFIAEAWAMSILVSQTHFLCSRVCTWSFATEAFRSEFDLI